MNEPETKEELPLVADAIALSSVSPGNIFEAMHAVYKAVGYVQKLGKVDAGKGGKYSYAGEKDLIAALRPAMVEAGIVFHCSAVEQVTNTEIRTVSVWDGKESVRVSYKTAGLFTYRFTHVASETFIEVKALGEGNDSLDKAAYKAMTGALKYALRQTFVIETGDDPDAATEDDDKSKSKKASKDKKAADDSKPDPEAEARRKEKEVEDWVNGWAEKLGRVGDPDKYDEYVTDKLKEGCERLRDKNRKLFGKLAFAINAAHVQAGMPGDYPIVINPPEAAKAAAAGANDTANVNN